MYVPAVMTNRKPQLQISNHDPLGLLGWIERDVCHVSVQKINRLMTDCLQSMHMERKSQRNELRKAIT